MRACQQLLLHSSLNYVLEIYILSQLIDETLMCQAPKTMYVTRVGIDVVRFDRRLTIQLPRDARLLKFRLEKSS